jgi:hypothetical protein
MKSNRPGGIIDFEGPALQASSGSWRHGFRPFQAHCDALKQQENGGKATAARKYAEFQRLIDSPHSLNSMIWL